MNQQIKIGLVVACVLTSGVLAYAWWPSSHAQPGKRAALPPAVQTAAAAAPVAPPVSDVDRVRNGVLPEYKNTTVKQAFEGTFQSPEWKADVNLQGEKVVSFQGTVKYTVLKNAGFYIGTWNGVQQGIDAEKQISEQRRRCYAAAGKPEIATADDAPIAPCMAKAYETMVVPVAFQFTLSADKKSVEMTRPDAVFQKFDDDHRLREYRDATLAFIYQ